MRRIILFLFALPYSAIAQVKDAGLWTSAGLKKKFSPSFSAELTQEFRFNENVTELGEFFTEVGLNYKIKRIKVSAGYRYINERRIDDSYSTRHRYYGDVTYSQPIARIELSLRERFQAQYKDILVNEKGMIPTHYLRSRLTASWKTGKRYKPYLAGEAHYQLNNPKGNEFDSMRILAGFVYEFNRLSEIDLFYMHKREFNVNDPWLEYIAGISYRYNL